MKPFIALIVFLTCMLVVFNLPTPNPSEDDHFLNDHAPAEKQLFDQPVEFFESPMNVSVL